MLAVEICFIDESHKSMLQWWRESAVKCRVFLPGLQHDGYPTFVISCYRTALACLGAVLACCSVGAEARSGKVLTQRRKETKTRDEIEDCLWS